MSSNDRQHIPVMGFFTPHAPTDWTGEILDLKTGELVKEPSMTKQSFKDECDINNIIRDFTKSGQIAHINERGAGRFADLPDQLDYQMAMTIAQQANQAFEALPAQIRARFENDPAQFLAFCDDPNNAPELVELGLAEAVPKPQAAPPVAPIGAVATEAPKP
ncbi:MAG: internal scaffolding protein [Microviridae sp.]|nr:MAG: internal scaffolding protein [Microviridae sp.]